MRKIITPVLLLSLTLSSVCPVQDMQAATNLTLSKSKITLTSGASTTVKANKTVKWKSSNPKIATVKKVSAKTSKIFAKKVGTCKITATFKKKKKTIRVTVKKPSNSQITATKTPKPQVSVTPTLQPVVTPTLQPVVNPTLQPVVTPTLQPVVTPTYQPTVEQPAVNPTLQPVVNPEYQPVTTPFTSSTDVVPSTQAPSTENLVSTSTPNSPVQISGISTKLISTDKEKVTFSITNKSGYEAVFGYDYTLEKSENGQWVPVKPTIPIAVPSIAISLSNGKTYTNSLSLNAYTPLESGTYRIVKVIYVNAPIQDGTNKTPNITTYTEFTLNENITQQPAPTTSTVTASPSAEPVVSTMRPAVTASTRPISATPTAVAEPQITPPAISTTQPTKEPALPPTEPIVTLVPSSAQPTEPSVTTAPVITSAPSIVISSGGVSAIIEGYNNGKLTYVLTNNLDHGHDIQWKDTLRIQKEVNGEWQDVEQTRYENKLPEIYTLSYGESQTYTENIANYFDLESGNYRMERTFYADTCKCAVVLDLPFEIGEYSINDNIVDQPIAPTPVVVSQTGVTMTLENYKDGNLTYILANDSGDTITYDYDYFILKEIDGAWVYVEPSKIPIMPDVLYILRDKDSVVWTENIKEIYDLQPGNYCMVKTFFFETYNYSPAQVALPFKV